MTLHEFFALTIGSVVKDEDGDLGAIKESVTPHRFIQWDDGCRSVPFHDDDLEGVSLVSRSAQAEDVRK